MTSWKISWSFLFWKFFLQVKCFSQLREMLELLSAARYSVRREFIRR